MDTPNPFVCPKCKRHLTVTITGSNQQDSCTCGYGVYHKGSPIKSELDALHTVVSRQSFPIPTVPDPQEAIDVLETALGDSPCPADDYWHTVADDHTDQKCWHARAKQLLTKLKEYSRKDPNKCP
jgi:hypothetical protein